jgi:hypothetical protein
MMHDDKQFRRACYFFLQPSFYSKQQNWNVPTLAGISYVQEVLPEFY